MDYVNIFTIILLFIVSMGVFYYVLNNIGIDGTKDKIGKTGQMEMLEKQIMTISNKLNELEKGVVKPDSGTGTGTPIVLPEIKINTMTNSTPTPSQPPIIFDPIANYDIAKLTDPLVDPRGRTSADQIPTPQVASQFNFPTQGVLDRYHRVGLLIAIKDPEDKKSRIEKRKAHNKKSNSRYVKYPSSSISETSSMISDTELGSTNSSNSSISEFHSRGIEIKEGFESDNESIEGYASSFATGFDNQILELIGKKITDNWYKYFTSITMGNKVIKIVVHNKNRKELYCGDVVYISELKRYYKVKIDPMDMIEYNPYFF